MWLDRAIEIGEDDVSIARIETFLAEVCREQRKYEESGRWYDQALSRYQRWYRSESEANRFGRPRSRLRTLLRANFAHFTGSLLAGRAAAMQALGRDDDGSHDLALAQRRLRLALRLEEIDLRRTDSLASMGLLTDLARVYLARGKSREAEPLLTRVLAITQAEIASPPARFTTSEQAIYRRNLGTHAAAVRRMLADSKGPATQA